MDFGLAFSFVFQDEEWIKKVLIAAVLSIIPILGQIVVLGWSLEVTRRVILKDPNPLPDWDDFGGLFVQGLKALVVGFVLAIPMIIISIPGSLLSAVLDPRDYETVIALISACTGCLAFLYGIVMAFAIPAAYGELAATDNLGSALNPARMWALVRAAPAAYLIVLLGVILAGFIAPLGTLLCVVGVFITGAYVMAFQGHLYGQAYLQATAGAPAA